MLVSQLASNASSTFSPTRPKGACSIIVVPMDLEKVLFLIYHGANNSRSDSEPPNATKINNAPNTANLNTSGNCSNGKDKDTDDGLTDYESDYGGKDSFLQPTHCLGIQNTQAPLSPRSRLSDDEQEPQVQQSQTQQLTEGLFLSDAVSVGQDSLSLTQLDATEVVIQVIGHEICPTGEDGPFVVSRNNILGNLSDLQLYHCEVTHNMATRLVKRRFKDIRVFHGQLGSAAYGIEPPSYHIFRSNKFQPAFLVQREMEMHNYFSQLSKKPMIAQNTVFATFFELDKMRDSTVSMMQSVSPFSAPLPP